jgi:hypothetical protein
MINKARDGIKLFQSTDSELAKRLSMIYFMIGLRPHHFPTEDEDRFLFAYIRKNFPNYTLDDIYLAFDMAIKNQLDIDDIKCYDQFSVEYFVRIMLAYKRYVRVVVANEPRKHKELPLSGTIISKEEKLADIKELYSYDSLDKVIIPSYIYSWMCELGYINLSDSDKVIMYRKAINIKLNNLQSIVYSNPLNKDARKEFTAYQKRVKDNFVNITSSEEAELHSIFIRLAVINQIKTDKKNATKSI